ncbi:MAG: nicotinamide riboside kinase [Pseudohongiellaceae bacterium]|jgi:nicotinamide riboside kinase
MNTQILVITGPESSGKTTLASQLSNHWRIPLVPEASRDYLKGRSSYQQCDLLEIAKQQYKKEQALLSNSPKRIICDTDLLVIIIWSEVKYGHCDPWIYTAFERSVKHKASSRIYYLCDYQIPWQADPLRENPNNRDELFKLYVQKLEQYKLDFKIVKGEPQIRLQQVLDNSNQL